VGKASGLGQPTHADTPLEVVSEHDPPDHGISLSIDSRLAARRHRLFKAHGLPYRKSKLAMSPETRLDPTRSAPPSHEGPTRTNQSRAGKAQTQRARRPWKLNTVRMGRVSRRMGVGQTRAVFLPHSGGMTSQLSSQPNLACPCHAQVLLRSVSKALHPSSSNPPGAQLSAQRRTPPILHGITNISATKPSIKHE